MKTKKEIVLISRSTLFGLILRLVKQLSNKRRFQFLILLTVMVISSLAEVISISLVIPFVGILVNSQLLWENNFLKNISLNLGFQQPEQILLLVTFLFCLASLMAGGIRLFTLYLNLRLSAGIGSDISCKIYKNTLYQEYQFHINKNSSEIITNIVNDIGRVIGEVINPLLQAISSFFITVSLVITLLVINAEIAFSTFFIISSIYIFIVLITKNKIRDLSSLQDICVNKLVKTLQEGIGSIKDVILNNSQNFFLNIYKSSDNPLRKSQAKGTFLSSFPRMILEPIGITIIAFFGFYLVSIGKKEEAIPLLGAMALGAQRLLPMAQKIYEGYTVARGAKVQLSNVVNLLETNYFSEEKNQNIKNFKFIKSIRFENVYFRYSKNEDYILRNISLTINKGERVGIIGKTGEGKSTLLDLLTGLLKPTKGKIYIDGKLLNSKKNDNSVLLKWRSIISYVPQMIYLSDSSLASNIAFATELNEVNHSNLRLSAKKAQISEFINALPDNYDTNVGERGVRLSGGQKQRIGIARALYKESQVIVLDEATSALDNSTEKEFIKSLHEIGNDLTVIMVTHRVSTLKNFDRVIKIENGYLN